MVCMEAMVSLFWSAVTGYRFYFASTRLRFGKAPPSFMPMKSGDQSPHAKAGLPAIHLQIALGNVSGTKVSPTPLLPYSPTFCHRFIRIAGSPRNTQVLRTFKSATEAFAL